MFNTGAMLPLDSEQYNAILLEYNRDMMMKINRKLDEI
jgi:hypothetical protein